MIEPYYQADGITIYHADCRDVLPELRRFDLLLTDPKYGIGASSMNLGYSAASRVESATWDDEPTDLALLESAIDTADKSIVWGGNYFRLPISRKFLVWDKGAGFKDRSFAECEQAWCSWDGNAQMYNRDPLAGGDYRGKVHKTQKPLPLMQWCLSLVPDAKTVLDPFLGSGTTAVACKLAGIECVGIEQEERYCESAVNRLRQRVFDFAGCE